MKSNTKFSLATGKIIRFEIPSQMKRGNEQKVKVKVHGNGKNLFWTLLLINPLNEQQWWPDNSTIDLIKNGGKKELKDEVWDSTWYFPIFQDATLGAYTAFLGVYQDTYGLPTFNRRLVAYDIKKVKVIKDPRESIRNSVAHGLDFKLAVKSEKEYFEILRDRIVWCICHNLISKNIRKFHSADMITECAGAFSDKEALTQYKLLGQHEYYKPTLEKIFRPLVEGGFIVELENNNFRIPKGSKLENICKTQLEGGKGYLSWNDINWD